MHSSSESMTRTFSESVSRPTRSATRCAIGSDVFRNGNHGGGDVTDAVARAGVDISSTTVNIPVAISLFEALMRDMFQHVMAKGACTRAQ